MDLATLIIAITFFGLAYQGIGLYLESRQPRPPIWSPQAAPASSASGSIRDFIGKFSRNALNRALLKNKKFRERMELLLVRSGYVYGWKPEDFLFYK